MHGNRELCPGPVAHPLQFCFFASLPPFDEEELPSVTGGKKPKQDLLLVECHVTLASTRELRWQFNSSQLSVKRTA